MQLPALVSAIEMLSKVLFLWNSTCQFTCLTVLWCWSMRPLFSVPPAFWNILGFGCIASQPSAAGWETKHGQSRSPCQVQLQRRCRDTCFPCSLCTPFPAFLPNQPSVLIRNHCGAEYVQFWPASFWPPEILQQVNVPTCRLLSSLPGTKTHLFSCVWIEQRKRGQC